MKTLWLAGCLSLFLAGAASPARANGSWPKADGARECAANHGWGDGAHYAEPREQRLASASTNSVNPGQNGSIRVHAWNNPDVLVKACIQTNADTDSEARQLASQVQIVSGTGKIEASGPSNQHDANWSVSYEIWMPASSAAHLEASNGSISVEGLRGAVHFHSLNGSVRLSDVGGAVEGDTTNGSVTVDVADKGWAGDQLRLRTVNGSVRLNLPENFSARVEASTVNGSVRTDFPITVSGEIAKHLSFTLGSGGPTIAADTVNGSVHIGRA